MIRLFDGMRLAEIEMIEWSKGRGKFSEVDFFQDGGLRKIDSAVENLYMVRDVPYCVDYALDWRSRLGDFAGDDWEEDRDIWWMNLYYVWACGGDEDGEITGIYYKPGEAIRAAEKLNKALPEGSETVYIATNGADGSDIY